MLILKTFLNFHKSNNKTLTVTGVHPPSRFGTFFQNDNNRITYDSNAKLEMHLSRINGGFMVANETIFCKLTPVSECRLETEVFSTLINEEQIALWNHNGFWQNVDTERDIELLQCSFDINKRPWLGIN